MTTDYDTHLQNTVETLKNKTQVLEALYLARRQLGSCGLEAQLQSTEFRDLARRGHEMVDTEIFRGKALWHLKLDRLVEQLKKERHSRDV